MSSGSIKSWASNVDDTADHEADSQRKWDGSEETWRDYLAGIRTCLFSSSVKLRVGVLSESLVALVKDADLSMSQTTDIFEILTLVYPRYGDKSSRDAADRIGAQIIVRDEKRENKYGVAEHIIAWLHTESQRISMKESLRSSVSSNRFILLTWAAALYTTCLENVEGFTKGVSWPKLIESISSLLDAILDPSSGAKPKLQKSAAETVKRAIRKETQDIKTLLETLLGEGLSISRAVLIGLTINVLIELESGASAVPSTLDSFRVPTRQATALEGYVRTSITKKDLDETFLPTMEKALLRAPEVALSVTRSFFVSYPHNLKLDQFKRILAPILSSSKSTNAQTRNGAVKLFDAVVLRPSLEGGDIMQHSIAADEILALPKAWKSGGPDHRIALYSMLRSIPPSIPVSLPILDSIPVLFSKERSDLALQALCVGIFPHLRHILSNGTNLNSAVISTLTKDADSSKPAVRRSVCSLVGNVLWDLRMQNTGVSAIKRVAEAMIGPFGSYLKEATSIIPNAPGGIFEGYVAVASLLGPLTTWFPDRAGVILKQYPTILTFTGQGSKASFLVWDKIYQRLFDSQDETWLLRALEAVATSSDTENITTTEESDRLLGLAFIYLAAESRNVHTRRDTVARLSELTKKQPKYLNKVVIAGLNAAVSKSIGEPAGSAARRAHQLRLVLATCASYDDATPTEIREDMLVQTLLLGHHPLIGDESQQSWVELLQRSGVEPASFVQRYAETFIRITCPPEAPSQAYSISRAARFHAATTLTFINSDVFLPRYVEIIESLLDPSLTKGLTQLDLEIWATPEGVPCVDVLAAKGASAVEKGKDQAIQQWEAEIRKNLSEKKGVAHLSKQDEALVRSQLEKEHAIRQNVINLRQRIIDGLDLVKSLVNTRMEAIHANVARISSALLACATERPADLVGTAILDAYVELGSCCEEAFSSISRWASIATLRAIGAKSVPEEIAIRPAGKSRAPHFISLLFTLGSRPFTPATLSFLSPLLSTVVAVGGFQPSNSVDSDVALEQLTLILNLIRAHSSNIGDAAYPRIDIMRNVITILTKHLLLAKEGSSLLVELGDGIALSASRAEIDFLIKSTLLEESHARNAILQALQPFDLTDLDWSPEIWVLCHDRDDQNARLARKLWDENGLDVSEDFIEPLLALLDNPAESVRWNAVSSLPESLEAWPSKVGKLVSELQTLYLKLIPNTEPQYDDLGILISDGLSVVDPWPARVAIGRALELVAPFMEQSEVDSLFDFLITKQALGDKNGLVRRAMLEAGVAGVEAHGAAFISRLMARFESHLASSSQSSDEINEAVVVLYGRLAGHLEADDTRLPTIVNQLVAALKTPSEQVQVAVAECLSPLAPKLPELDELVEDLFKELFGGARYADRRGAAYGLAGVVHGLGISSINSYDVLERLKRAINEKKKHESRQGALFALETLATTLTRLFEPYITEIVPLLLQSYGDGTSDVREATEDASKAIMASLSSYGVKLILPSLLVALDEKQWRTKKGAIELLGAMAFCSPKQLSISLPSIIPRLTSVLTDSHAQVRSAANKSLKQFGEVISNPEIQRMVPVLLKGLVDPDKIPAGLSVLLKTTFMHYIDSPSLALVIPILERGLKQRGDPKRKACQIVGNMASLTDTKDFVPYLPRLLPLVHGVLVDPVPEARATAAKSLGTLVERMGEVYFPDLVPGLLQTLKSETSAIDRQGAAQGLSEVLSGLGMDRLEGLLPDIINNCTSSRPFVREGFMSLLIYLPATFGARFQPHLGKIVSPILSGLADDEQTVQDAAMKAGRMIIVNYSSRAVELLLPELEISMFSEGWKIRQSSLTLVGELLFKVAGISGKADVEEEEAGEEETAALEISRKALTDQLGKERRDRLLASFYILRQDAVAVVRQSSIHIWKPLVQNTPRTIREILPSLIDKVLELLANAGSEQQDTAARTMGELCKKFGERLVSEIVPLLQAASRSPDRRTREGVCLALSNIMENTTDTQREGHEDEIVVIVRDSLVDQAPNVRAAAAKTFDILQKFMGARAIDQTIPTLLESLRQPGESSGTALQALKEVMTVRAATVFPVLIPTLLAVPVTAFNLRALASLVSVSGNALSKRVNTLLGSLVKLLETETDEKILEEANECIEAIFQTIDDAEGLNTVMLLLLGWAKHDNPVRRASSAKLFEVFCGATETDFSLYWVDWVRQLISMFDDPIRNVVESAVKAFAVFTKVIPKEEYEDIIVPIRRSIESTGAPGRTVLGFSLPNALAPLVPILITGLTTGSNEQREQAANAISDLVDRTEQAAFKPVVVPFTGPLIRVATQVTNFPPAVKVGILGALEKQVRVIPTFVKPFFPQLQRTFVKAVGDVSSVNVRTKAGDALGELMKHQPRVDQICTELIAGATNPSEDESVQTSFVYALAMVIRNASHNVGDATKTGVLDILNTAFSGDHLEQYIDASALLFASMTAFPDLISPLVKKHLTSDAPPSATCSTILLAILSLPPELEPGAGVFAIYGSEVVTTIAKKIVSSAASDRQSISRPAKEAKDLMIANSEYADVRYILR